MGITVNNFPLFNGAVDISGVYVYVRDIRTTKRSDTEHEINFTIYYTKDVSGVIHNIKTDGHYEISSNVITDSWSSAYNCVKSKLNALGLTYVDS